MWDIDLYVCACVCSRVRVRAGVRVLYTYVTKYVGGNVNKDVGESVCLGLGLKFNPKCSSLNYAEESFIIDFLKEYQLILVGIV